MMFSYNILVITFLNRQGLCGGADLQIPLNFLVSFLIFHLSNTMAYSQQKFRYVTYEVNNMQIRGSCRRADLTFPQKVYSQFYNFRIGS